MRCWFNSLPLNRSLSVSFSVSFSLFTSLLTLAPPAVAQSAILQEKLKDFDYWSDLCNLQVEGGKYTEAQPACEAAIVLRPKSAITWAEHSNILLKLKQYPEAIASAEQALKLDPKTSPFIQIFWMGTTTFLPHISSA